MTSETAWSDGCSEDLQLSRARARQAKVRDAFNALLMLTGCCFDVFAIVFQAQLQRCALYSAGSRARLPRTKVTDDVPVTHTHSH